jgi:hypothetical protein
MIQIMTKEEIIKIVDSDKKGFYIGNRLILPFRCNILKLVVDSHIFTEFVGNKDVKLSQEAQNTSIYFREVGRLSEFEGAYQSIKLLIAGESDDLTDKSNHIVVICHILGKREIELESPTEDDLFIV